VKDPRVRKNGTCAQCGGERKMPRTHHGSINVAVYLLDPFCSSNCARAYHGVKLTGISAGRPRAGQETMERGAAA
jgi:hypothetical protein